MLLESLLSLATAIAPPVLAPSAPNDDRAIEFAPFDFGDEPLGPAPLEMRSATHTPTAVTEAIAAERDALLARLHRSSGGEIPDDAPSWVRTTVRMTEVGGGLQLWIIEMGYSTWPSEHYHLLYSTAHDQVGAVASWHARWWTLGERSEKSTELAGFARTVGAIDAPPTNAFRTDWDEDGIPELTLYSREHNGTMWNASSGIVLDIGADLTLKHVLKFHTWVDEVPTGAQLNATIRAERGGPSMQWFRQEYEPDAPAQPVGSQRLGRERSGDLFEIRSHESLDPSVDWLVSTIEHLPDGG